MPSDIIQDKDMVTNNISTVARDLIPDNAPGFAKNFKHGDNNMGKTDQETLKRQIEEMKEKIKASEKLEAKREDENRKAAIKIQNLKKEKMDLMKENERISKELTEAKSNNMQQNVTRIINIVNERYKEKVE